MEELPLLVKRVIAQTVPGTLRLKVMTEGKISFLITGFPPHTVGRQEAIT